jgi:Zn-dependent protease with chaperone function
MLSADPSPDKRASMIPMLVVAATLWLQAPAPPASSAGAAVSETAPVAVPDPGAKALAYYRSGNVLWVVDQVFEIALLVVILITGFSARLRNIAQRIGRRWLFTIAAYYVLFTLVTFVVSLPLSYYEEFVREHAYGLSNQTLQKWLSDTFTSLAVACVAGALFVWVPYLLLRRSPRRWWLYTSLAIIPFVIAANLIAPIWIAPLFNRFEPMRDKALEARILALADRANIEGSRVYEVNKSVDTKTINAYVAGLGGTKRIVLWDTIIARMNERELLFVMGHEMGHYVLHHIWQAIAFSVLLVLIAFYGAYRLSDAAIRRWGDRFGFATLADVASLPLLLLLTSIVSLAIAPAQLAFTRHLEHEADRFGLEITQTNHSAGTAFVKLQEESLSNPWPGPLYVLWRASHPPLGERITFSNTYHPWRDGAPLRYGDRFKAPPALTSQR